MCGGSGQCKLDYSCELVESDPPFLQTLALDCPAELPGGERCLRMFEDHKKAAAGRAAIAHAERRSHPRYACTAATEVVDMGSGARSNGRTADVGRGGCFVDTINPFPVGALVKIRITREGATFEAQAKVVYAMVGMGMGLMFTSAEAAQYQVLEKWIAELAGSTPSDANLTIEKEQEPKETNAKNEQHYVLYELIITLIRKGVLTDAEGKTFLQKLLH